MLHSVLIVDNTEFMRFVMREIMSELPIGMIADAGELEEAVDLCRALEPDAAVIDFTAPEMQPADVLRALRQENPDLQIVAVVAPDDASGRREALDLGAGFHIVKPFDPPEVVSVLRDALEAVPAG